MKANRLATFAAMAVLGACAYVPRQDSVASMSVHEARVYVINTLTHDPVTFRPERLDDYSGQILSVEIGGGRLKIVTANRTLDLALTEIEPKTSGTRVFLTAERYVVTPYPDSMHLADALFTLKQAALKGSKVDD